MSSKVRMKAIGIGVLIAVAVLLLDDLARTLRAFADQQLSSPLWAVAVMLLVGAVVVYGALLGRSDPTTPVVAALLLAWPILAATTPLPSAPGWVPLLSGAPTDVLLQTALVGVLVMGIVLGRHQPDRRRR